MSVTALVIHRDDLRLDDNRTLRFALDAADEVVSMVVIDPSTLADGPFGFPRQGARRLQWRLKSIEELRRTYRSLGGELLVRVGSVAACVAEVARSISADLIVGQRAKTSEETRCNEAVERETPNCCHHWLWNDLLFDPETLPFDKHTFPRGFTKFRKIIERDYSPPKSMDRPLRLNKRAIDAGRIPSLADFGLEALTIEPSSPISDLWCGESGATRQIERYIWQSEHLKHYKETRNGMLHWSDSSRLSLYFAHGNLSPRSVMREVRTFEEQRGANQSTYWLYFELLWREYFHHLAFHVGAELFAIKGLQRRTVHWNKRQELFDRWCFGLTGFPMVDACMRELLATGYMSNRGRQIVASHLTKGMGVDWRLGAYWFEHHLIDYDVCVNWGNWQYVAGVGTDPRDRQFNVRRQAKTYDPSGEFVYRWCPELRQLDAAEHISMNVPPFDPWKESLNADGQFSNVGNGLS